MLSEPNVQGTSAQLLSAPSGKCKLHSSKTSKARGKGCRADPGKHNVLTRPILLRLKRKHGKRRKSNHDDRSEKEDDEEDDGDEGGDTTQNIVPIATEMHPNSTDADPKKDQAKRKERAARFGLKATFKWRR